MVRLDPYLSASCLWPKTFRLKRDNARLASSPCPCRTARGDPCRTARTVLYRRRPVPYRRRPMPCRRRPVSYRGHHLTLSLHWSAAAAAEEPPPPRSQWTRPVKRIVGRRSREAGAARHAAWHCATDPDRKQEPRRARLLLPTGGSRAPWLASRRSITPQPAPAGDVTGDCSRHTDPAPAVPDTQTRLLLVT